MKKFTKILAALLALSLLFSLCACGNDKDASNKKDNSEISTEKDDDSAQSTANIGDLLTEPEKIPENIDFYALVNFADESSETGVISMEIAKDDSDNSGVLYMTDGMLKSEEVIMELDENDDITVYTRDLSTTKFTKSDLSEDEKEEALQTGVEILNTLGLNYDYSEAETTFKKLKNEKLSLIGECFVYELIEENEYVGKIWVDAKTGLFVKLEDSDGAEVFTVIKIDTENLGIPDYK